MNVPSGFPSNGDQEVSPRDRLRAAARAGVFGDAERRAVAEALAAAPSMGAFAEALEAAADVGAEIEVAARERLCSARTAPSPRAVRLGCRENPHLGLTW